MVRTVEDESLAIGDRQAKVKELYAQMLRKGEEAFKGVQVAEGNFRKQHGQV